MTSRRTTTLGVMAPFLLGGVVVAAVVFVGVPGLASRGIEPLVGWMCLAPPFVFLPLIVWGWWSVRREAPSDLSERLWLRRPGTHDWLAALAGVVAIVVLSAPLAWLAVKLGLAIHPPTMPSPPALTRETLWVVGLWLVYWPINMLGEEFVWRGVLLPRTEAHFGSRAWRLNAFSWFLFHLSFGPGNLLVLLPTLAIVPWVVQRRRNAWLGVVLHATPSLPGFIAMALGKV